MQGDWSDTLVDFRTDVTLHELLIERAKQSPNALACIYDNGKKMSYAELLTISTNLASKIHPFVKGEKDQCIGLLLPKGIEEVIGMVAIMLAGAAYVPLDVKLPEDRLQFQVEQCKCVALITQDEFGLLASKIACMPILMPRASMIHTNAGKDQGACSDFKPVFWDSSSLAYVMFTSGSTGKPKGVMLEHRQVVALVTRLTSSMVPKPTDRLLYAPKFTFDGSVYLMWSAFYHGASLVVPQGDLLTDPAVMRELVHSAGVTYLRFVPMLMNFYVTTFHDFITPAVRVAICGGDVFKPELAKLLKSTASNLNIFNAYGPTEVTVSATVYDFSAERHTYGDNATPIGRGIPNSQCYILDETKNLSPVGVPGELYVGGPKLARGYMGRPDLTEKAFVEVPSLGEAGQRLYKTGDLVKWLECGNIVFLGRTDFQIKVNGQRIEASEIEGVINEVDGVSEVVVTAKEVGKSLMIVAYMEGDSSVVTEAQAACEKRLPKYMVPASFVALRKFPYNTNGKVDRKQIESQVIIEADLPSLPTSYEDEDRDYERVLQVMLKTIKDVSGIDATENSSFLAVGIDSLATVTFTALIKERLDVEVDILTAAQQHKTVGGLARHICESKLEPQGELDPESELLSNLDALPGLRFMTVVATFCIHHNLATQDCWACPYFQNANDMTMLFYLFGLLQYNKNLNITSWRSFAWVQLWMILPQYYLVVALNEFFTHDASLFSKFAAAGYSVWPVWIGILTASYTYLMSAALGCRFVGLWFVCSMFTYLMLTPYMIKHIRRLSQRSTAIGLGGSMVMALIFTNYLWYIPWYSIYKDTAIPMNEGQGWCFDKWKYYYDYLTVEWHPIMNFPVYVGGLFMGKFVRDEEIVSRRWKHWGVTTDFIWLLYFISVMFATPALYSRNTNTFLQYIMYIPMVYSLCHGQGYLFRALRVLKPVGPMVYPFYLLHLILGGSGPTILTKIFGEEAEKWSGKFEYHLIFKDFLVNLLGAAIMIYIYQTRIIMPLKGAVEYGLSQLLQSTYLISFYRRLQQLTGEDSYDYRNIDSDELASLIDDEKKGGLAKDAGYGLPGQYTVH